MSTSRGSSGPEAMLFIEACSTTRAYLPSALRADEPEARASINPSRRIGSLDRQSLPTYQ